MYIHLKFFTSNLLISPLRKRENLKADFNAISVSVCKNRSEIFYFERKYFAFVASRDKRNFSHPRASSYIYPPRNIQMNCSICLSPREKQPRNKRRVAKTAWKWFRLNLLTLPPPQVNGLQNGKVLPGHKENFRAACSLLLQIFRWSGNTTRPSFSRPPESRGE